MKRIYIIILLLIVTSGSRLIAQTNLFALQYSVGFTMGDFKDFIGKESWRGVTMDYRSMVNENVGVGIETGWNAFYEKKDYATYVDGTRSLSGTQFRYCSAIPILVSADYYFNPGESLSPFIGLGIGTIYTRNDLDMGLYTIREDVWHFALKPEAGLLFKTRPDFGIMLCVKYYNGFNSEDLGTRNYVATNIGFVWEY